MRYEREDTADATVLAWPCVVTEGGYSRIATIIPCLWHDTDTYGNARPHPDALLWTVHMYIPAGTGIMAAEGAERHMYDRWNREDVVTSMINYMRPDGAWRMWLPQQ